jgi:hypothetical protein
MCLRGDHSMTKVMGASCGMVVPRSAMRRQALNECTPIATRFHQLGGESGRIVRYLPPGDCSGASSACSRVM